MRIRRTSLGCAIFIALCINFAKRMRIVAKKKKKGLKNDFFSKKRRMFRK